MKQAHPVDVHVGKRLRLRRSMVGMSQDTMGKAIGVSFQQVQKYERGINRMGSSRLYEFSRLLDVPISYFFEDFDEAEASDYAVGGMSESAAPEFEHEDEQLSTRETMEMMRAYYQIPSRTVRRRIFDLIKSLANEQSS